MKFKKTVRKTVFMMGALVCLAASGLEARKVDPRDHSPAQGIAGATRAKPVELPKGAGEDWWRQVKGHIAAEEYEAVWTDYAGLTGERGAWRAQNMANGFESCFTEKGVRVVRRLKDGLSWELGLDLVRWGREGSLREVSPGKSRAAGNRVDLDRGAIQEWFINDERGLEQGFTILRLQAENRRGGAPSPPVLGSNGVGPQRAREGAEALHYGLHLDLALTGTLHPRISEDGQAVDFFQLAGNVSVLRYSELKVNDATGRILPSRFEGWCGYGGQNAGGGQNAHPTTVHQPLTAAYGGLRISINDTGAVYPITVDPLATSPAWTALGENSGDQFGYSVATAGDVNGDGYSDVVIGAPVFSSFSGKAYLFLGGAAGLSSTAAWSAVGQNEGDEFGCSVATAGDVNGDGYGDVAVGAKDFNSSRGKAYLFLGGPSGLTGTPASPAWSATGEAASNVFGFSLGTAGDVNGDGYSDVVVGAYQYGGTIGRAYLYLGGASGLSNTANWIATGEGSDNWYGYSMATAGDVNADGYADLVVGAASIGKSYLYLGSSAGLPGTASWIATGEVADDAFGYSVSTAGDVNGDGYSDVVIGGPRHNVERGRAYLYLGGASGLSSTYSWTADGTTPGWLGNSVATAGDVNGDGYSDVVIGSYWDEMLVGKAYLYLGGASGLSATASWVGTAQNSGDQYGCSVATAGDVNGDGFSDVVAGAYGFSAFASTGKAFLYLGGPSGISGTAATAPWTAVGESPGEMVGGSVASAGDVNGDGYSDLVIGASGFNMFQGKAYLYLGGPSGLSTEPSWSKAGEFAGDYFGWSVASAGDVNGDGYADVVIGAQGFGSFTGKAYLFLGGPSGLASAACWTRVGEAPGGYFGVSVVSAGDVDGDGFCEVVIGAYDINGSQGKAYLFMGGLAGLSTTPDWSKAGESPGDYLGWSVAPAGDVNGDGYCDVVIGAPGSATHTGKVYLYLGGPSGLSGTAAWSKAGESSGDYFGWAVATAGDANGDGYADILASAPMNSSYAGRAYLYLGGPSEPSSTASWWVSGDGTTRSLGYSLASAGDVNGDGYSDVIVGAHQSNSNQGTVNFYLGGPSGPSSTAAWTGLGESAGDRFGISVATAGDVNGDAFSDVIIGADDSEGTSGTGYLFYGDGGPGLPARARQLRADLSAPIAPLGLAHDKSFRIGMNMRSPVGRTLARFQWQTAPLGGTFSPWANPVQTYSTAYSAKGPGSFRTMPVTLVEAPMPYIWRARLKYSAVSSPFLPYSPWFTPSANGLCETDLRSVSDALPPACVIPDEPCWLYSVTKSGTDYTLNWQDPNQTNQRTGWNIRRSNEASILPKTAWPLVGSNVVDMDASTANYQWTDHSGDDPGPGGVWYYQVTAYNSNCPAEGPF